jgi:hypothetical protein
MWIFPIFALVLIGRGLYLRSEDSDVGIVLIVYSGILFILATLAALRGRNPPETGSRD